MRRARPTESTSSTAHRPHRAAAPQSDLTVTSRRSRTRAISPSTNLSMSPSPALQRFPPSLGPVFSFHYPSDAPVLRSRSRNRTFPSASRATPDALGPSRARRYKASAKLQTTNHHAPLVRQAITSIELPTQTIDSAPRAHSRIWHRRTSSLNTEIRALVDDRPSKVLIRKTAPR